MDFEESKQSKFNAGVALAERLDGLQKALTTTSFNPLMMNPETGRLNYEDKVTTCLCLLNEAWGKLSETEKPEARRIEKTLVTWIEYNPICRLDNSGNLSINYNNYKKLMVLMSDVIKKIMEYLEAHSLNSPNINMDVGLA